MKVAVVHCRPWREDRSRAAARDNEATVAFEEGGGRWGLRWAKRSVGSGHHGRRGRRADG